MGSVSMSFHLFFFLFWNIEHPLMYGIQEKPYRNQPRKRNKFCLVPNNKATNDIYTYVHTLIHTSTTIYRYICTYIYIYTMADEWRVYMSECFSWKKDLVCWSICISRSLYLLSAFAVFCFLLLIEHIVCVHCRR